jgi:hypothetical protein
LTDPYPQNLLAWSIEIDAVQGDLTLEAIKRGVGPAYLPNPDSHGTEAVRLRVTAESGDSSEVDLTIVVRPRNDAPVMQTAPSATVQSTPTLIVLGHAGSWSDTIDQVPGSLTFIYRWEVADNEAGTNARVLDGETSLSPSLSPSDDFLGRYIRLVVTVIDDGEGLPASRALTAASDFTVIGSQLITYNDWQFARFPAGTPAADLHETANSDGDAQVNLLEYALGTDPLVADATVIKIRVEVIDGSAYSTFSYTEMKGRSDLTYTVETSVDLVNWNPIVGSHDVLQETNDTRLIRAKIPYASGSLFMRLNVVK